VTRLLFAWLGTRDLAAAADDDRGAGPVALAATTLAFDEVHLLCDYAAKKGAAFQTWLARQTEARVVVHPVTITGPTHYGSIYEAAVATCGRVLAGRRDAEATFHLSPGTPAMHAVWILIAKTLIPGRMIETSKENGVVTVDIPFDISAELVPIVGARLAGLTAGAPPELAAFSDIIHRSREMARVLEQAARAARWAVPILIEGESGTGKELMARAIHDASKRKGKFVAVNCGAIPANLLESELFGHVRGAFTDATRTRRGLFEEADGGTLFLDEIGELPLALQVKLLRVLQEGEIRRVGDTKPLLVDVRVVAATVRDLPAEVKAAAGFAKTSSIASTCCRSRCPRCARGRATSRCSSTTSSTASTGRRRPTATSRSAFLPAQGTFSSPTTGRGTSASWRTRSAGPSCGPRAR
jgi:sigma54-dependent transcription regulator